MSLARLFVSACLALALSALPASALDVGDLAPVLSIAEWVKGEKVEFPKDAQKKVHVVEFWATWCGPCKITIPRLTELQQKYKSDLVILSVTSPDAGSNSPAAIKRFVTQQGSSMNYTVAIDKDNKTTEAYMTAAGADGIPHAFLVGKDGRIAWQGSPLDPEFSDVIDRLIKGDFNVNEAKVERDVSRRLEALDIAARMGQWTTVRDGLKEILKLDPDNEIALGTIRRVYVEKLQDTEGLRKWTKSFIGENRSNARALGALANELCDATDPASATPDLALEAAKAAYEAAKDKDAATLAVYARALYTIGKVDRAISLQRDAIALASDGDRKAMQGTLEFYSLCMELQSASP